MLTAVPRETYSELLPRARSGRLEVAQFIPEVPVSLVLALDKGTTSSRAILFDHAGLIISSAQKEFRQIFPNPDGV